MKLVSLLKKEAQELFPAYFALPMATGIISIAAHLLHYNTISQLLFWLNNLLYAILLLMLVIRLTFYFPRFYTDLAAYSKGAGFFTVVAATAILGVQYVQLRQSYAPANMLWYAALGMWTILIYSFFVLITTKEKRTSLEKGMNGVWLLMVVATQNTSILGTLLAKQLPFPRDQILFFTLSAFFIRDSPLYHDDYLNIL